MKLQRASAQSHQTLYEFYADHSGEVGERMLALLARLEPLADEVAFWGLTSLAHLHLLAQDDASSTRLVTVVGGRDGYYISYHIPADITPWNGARVECVALDLESAVRMLAVAMRRSGGWSSVPGGDDASGIKSVSPFELNNRSRSWKTPRQLSSGGALSTRFMKILDANATDYWVKEQGPKTLRLLQRVEQLGDTISIWGSIPTEAPEPNILLRPSEALDGPYAMVRCGVVEYSIPEAKAPYPGAEVSGTFSERGVAEDETYRRLLVAMNECGGWSGYPQ